MNTLKKILISKRYLEEEIFTEVNKQKQAWLNAYLFTNFGIVVDQPNKLTETMVKDISDIYCLKVPASFYKNPQDTKYYSCDELLIEQVLSYFLAYGADDSHVEIFEKTLPEYSVGSEIKVREFCILSPETVASVLTDVCKDYASYKRPWSRDEKEEFEALYSNGYYSFTEMPILCGDNAVSLLDIDIDFARFLYKKDVVKLSISKLGERKNLTVDSKTLFLLKEILPLVKDCPMSKKQAKYYNKLVKITNTTTALADNKQSPNRLALKELKAGNVVKAAEIFSKNGSLLERNLKFLLSRANPIEAVKILDLLQDKNPTVLYQLLSTVLTDSEDARVFTFYAQNMLKTHIETDYETRWRKSRLNESTKQLVSDICFNKIGNHYKNAESLGKVYIAPNFYKVALPINTSASGKGIDVPPTGTRLPINGSAIRSFVHWKKAFDIDASVIVKHDDGKLNTINFCNYSHKPYGNDILFSGDITSANGTEYFDINLEGVRKRGVKYIVFTFHGYCDTLNKGEIFCGYQNKENLNTKAWDPKNIELKIHVKGEKRACIGFAIDVEANEIIVLNLIQDNDSQVVNKKDFKTIEALLNPVRINLNMGLVASWRGEVVEDLLLADVVFDDDYLGTPSQQVIRSFDIEKLAAIINV